jgi:hypothetical protein
VPGCGTEKLSSTSSSSTVSGASFATTSDREICGTVRVGARAASPSREAFLVGEQVEAAQGGESSGRSTETSGQARYGERSS